MQVGFVTMAVKGLSKVIEQDLIIGVWTPNILEILGSLKKPYTAYKQPGFCTLHVTHPSSNVPCLAPAPHIALSHAIQWRQTVRHAHLHVTMGGLCQQFMHIRLWWWWW
jgi:hypothetical protein